MEVGASAENTRTKTFCIDTGADMCSLKLSEITELGLYPTGESVNVLGSGGMSLHYVYDAHWRYGLHSADVPVVCSRLLSNT